MLVSKKTGIMKAVGLLCQSSVELTTAFLHLLQDLTKPLLTTTVTQTYILIEGQGQYSCKFL